MGITSITSNYLGSYFSSQEVEMIKTLKVDLCWEDNQERVSQRLLQEKSPYILSQGQNSHTFVIYYLKTGLINEAVFTLEQASSKWFFRNGGDLRSSDSQDIIKYILQPH